MESKQVQTDIRPTQTIPKYFKDQNVFITGATGFMGKVLVEKLLRSCPEIGTVYVLIRSKKGISGQDRWKKAVKCELFDKLRATNETILEKVKVIEGDVLKLGLGLDPIDRQEIIDKVTIFYHLAASVKFNDTLKDAVLMNVRGARETCKLVLEIKNLLVFLHVSTAYCQIGISPLKEELYPARGNPYEAIQLAETMDAMTLKMITPKYCEGFPNTYSFTKCLSETLIKDKCDGKVQLVVFRPTIVSPAINDPIKGWVDNFNGPIGICFAGSKGVLRMVKSKKESTLDYAPVDSAISGIIKATWCQSILKNPSTSVYNCSNQNLFKVTMNDSTQEAMAAVAEKEIWSQPMMYPKVYFTMSNVWYWINVYLFQVLPAITIDSCLKIAGKKPMLVPLQQKLVSLVTPIVSFFCRDWHFENKKFIKLDEHLILEDEKEFGNQMDVFDVSEWYIDSFMGISKVAREKTNKKNFVLYKRLKLIYYVWNTFWFVIIGLAAYNHIFMLVFRKLCVYFSNL